MPRANWWSKSRNRRGQRLAVSALECRTVPTIFSNLAPITIPGASQTGGAGPADPYPSPISVTGFAADEVVTDVNVTLTGLSHEDAGDLDILLVAPNGTAVLLMSDAGDFSVVSAATITFDDAAADDVSSSGVNSGTFKPTNYGTGVDAFSGATFTAPAASTLSAFGGLAPNGQWNLYIQDDAGGFVGNLSGGWKLDVTARSNKAPVSGDDTYTIAEDTLLSKDKASGVLANDTDSDLDTLTAVLVTPPVRGSLTFNPDGSFDYLPDNNFNGTVSFTYKAFDGIVFGNTAAVNITVTPVNDEPLAAADAYKTHQGRAIVRDFAGGVIHNDRDEATVETLLFEGFETVPLGNFVEESGSAKYPTDGTDWTNIAPLGWGIDNQRDLGPNKAGGQNDVGVPGVFDPAASNGKYEWAGWAFVDKTVWLNADDQGRSQFANAIGTVAVADPDEWDDAPHPLGTYNTFLRTAPVSLTNVLPGTLKLSFDSSWDYEANDDSGLYNNQTASVRASFDGGLTYQNVLIWDSEPASPNFHNTAYNEFVTLSVNNPAGATSVILEFGLTIAENDWWWAIDNVKVEGERSTSTLTATKVTGPSNGSLTFNADGSFVYTPTGSFVGTDSFTYKLSDGTFTSPETTVSIDVVANSFAPVGSADLYGTVQGKTLSVIAANGVLANDTDNDVAGNGGLTVTVFAGPANGDLTFNADGSFAYTAKAGFSGNDTFSYQATDGAAKSAPTTVTIAVKPGVTAADDTSTGNDGVAQVINVLANDTTTAGVLVPIIAAQGQNGKVTPGTDGKLIYTPNAGFVGTDSFRYWARVGNFTDSNLATVTVTVIDFDDTPVAVDDTYKVAPNQKLSVAAPGVLGNDTDTDSKTITAALVTSVSKGTLDFKADGSFDFTPPAGFTGLVTFTYKASDGNSFSNVATASLFVGNPPVAKADAYTVAEDAKLTVAKAQGVLANDSDPDLDPLVISLVTTATQGTLNLNADGSFDYTPKPDFNGTDAFFYKLVDGAFESDTVQVTITVSRVIDGPTPRNDVYVTPVNTTLTTAAVSNLLVPNSPLGVTNNDSRETLYWEDFQQLDLIPFAANVPGGQGKDWSPVMPFGWTRDNGTTPTPAQGNWPEFYGFVPMNVDTWIRNQGAPTGQDRYLFGRAGTGLQGTALIADGDAYDDGPGPIGANSINFLASTPVISLAGVLPNSVTLAFDSSFRPEDAQTEVVEVSYDGGAFTELVRFDGTTSGPDRSRINERIVLAANNPAGATSVQFRFGYLTADNNWWWAIDNISIQGDVANPTTAAKVTGPTNGALTFNADGSFEYIPTAGFTGRDTFTYTLSDGTKTSAPATVAIDVRPPVQVVINAGDAQRSMVQSIEVEFDRPVRLASGTAVTLTGTDLSGQPITVTALNRVGEAEGTSFIFTVTAVNGAAPLGGSLIDGNYTITIDGNNVRALADGVQIDADGDGNPGGTKAFTFHRLFGDADGNKATNFNDFLAFRSAFGLSKGTAGYSVAFDSDADGDVDFNDFLQFRTRFGVTLP